MAASFQVEARCGAARAGTLETAHGPVQTPVFMPVGTVGTVKGVPQETLEELGAELLLSNTYHLYLRPGTETVRKLGGLHRFMSWERALLTDSGGFQVFSLNELRKVSEEGVEFRSHLDGSRHFFTPESATAAQIALGADVIMAFDECTEHPAEEKRARESMELTLRWAERCRRHFDGHKEEVPWGKAEAACGRDGGPSLARPERKSGGLAPDDTLKGRTQALFGIVQGGMHAELRRESAQRTVALGFDGYAIGGLSVGEPRDGSGHAGAPAGRPAAVPHGGGHAGGDRGVRADGHRHDGLRAAHAGGAPRPALHLGGKDLDQAGALRAGRRRAGSGVRMPGVRALFTSLPAASLRLE
jgi:queuine tRNA-ribosyltransferase